MTETNRQDTYKCAWKIESDDGSKGYAGFAIIPFSNHWGLYYWIETELQGTPLQAECYYIDKYGFPSCGPGLVCAIGLPPEAKFPTFENAKYMAEQKMSGRDLIWVIEDLTIENDQWEHRQTKR